jgi:hypothetical protein
VKIADLDVMEIAVAAPHHAVMAEALEEAKAVTAETRVHHAVMDLQVKVADHAVMAPQDKEVDRVVMAEIAMVHADSVIVTAHVSRSVTGWKSHATFKSSSSLKTNQPKLWQTTFATAATLLACLMPHVSSSQRAIASRHAIPVPQSAPRVCS